MKSSASRRSPASTRRGRGPLAGPVVAAAVILPARRHSARHRRFEEARRGRAPARLHDRLRDCAMVGVGIVEAEEIDRLNIYWATMKAMTLAVEALGQAPAPCAGRRQPPAALDAPGDGDRLGRRHLAVDRRCVDHRQAHPRHDHDRARRIASALWMAFEQGLYLPRTHLDALRAHGPSPLHRRSFAPVAAGLARFLGR